MTALAVTDVLDVSLTDAAAMMDAVAMVIDSEAIMDAASTDAEAVDVPTVVLIDSAAINSTAALDAVDNVVLGMLLPLSPKHVVRL